MSKQVSDVIHEWHRRGYPDEPENRGKLLSCIEQAKDNILSYCNIPLKANVPDELFFTWVEFSKDIFSGISEGGQAETVKTISEGDTSITFDRSGSAKSEPLVSYMSILKKFRRLP